MMSVTVPPKFDVHALIINVTTRKLIHSDATIRCLRTERATHVELSDVT